MLHRSIRLADIQQPKAGLESTQRNSICYSLVCAIVVIQPARSKSSGLVKFTHSPAAESQVTLLDRSCRDSRRAGPKGYASRCRVYPSGSGADPGVGWRDSMHLVSRCSSTASDGRNNRVVGRQVLVLPAIRSLLVLGSLHGRNHFLHQ